MPADLDSLLLDITDLTDTKIEALGRLEYRQSCIDANGYGTRLTHDGQRVRFWETRFDHAFYCTEDRFSNTKTRIDSGRVSRVKWLCEVIGGNAPNSDCWETQQNLYKRFYRVVGKGYIIWLERYHADYWTFSTAYNAPIEYLHRLTRGKVKRVWKYGQKNAP